MLHDKPPQKLTPKTGLKQQEFMTVPASTRVREVGLLPVAYTSLGGSPDRDAVLSYVRGGSLLHRDSQVPAGQPRLVPTVAAGFRRNKLMLPPTLRGLRAAHPPSLIGQNKSHD